MSQFAVICEFPKSSQRPTHGCDGEQVGKLNLVDLAGSERVRITGATGCVVNLFPVWILSGALCDRRVLMPCPLSFTMTGALRLLQAAAGGEQEDQPVTLGAGKCDRRPHGH